MICPTCKKSIACPACAADLPERPAAVPPGQFAIGDTVRKRSGSAWSGTIVGTYRTSLTPEGYAVESDSHAGSVQIYPAAALIAAAAGVKP